MTPSQLQIMLCPLQPIVGQEGSMSVESDFAREGIFKDSMGATIYHLGSWGL